MAERKATNKYYPPNWDPSKGSINTYVGQHPLRGRARKLDEGILVIRFEMPFGVWCEGCDKHIGAGVRYNAEKKKIGKYYSTPIFSFRMKCHLCSSWIEIHTNPKDSEYVIASGARKRIEEYSAEDAGVIDINGGKEKDIIEKIEHEGMDRTRSQQNAHRIVALMKESDRKWTDPYERSVEIRRIFRKEKKRRDAEIAEGVSLARKYSLPGRATPLSKDGEKIVETMSQESRRYHRHMAAEEGRAFNESIFGNRSRRNDPIQILLRNVSRMRESGSKAENKE